MNNIFSNLNFLVIIINRDNLNTFILFRDFDNLIICFYLIAIILLFT